MRHDHLFIGGQWVESESDEVYTRRDPATGNVVSRHDRATRAEAERAITAAREAFDHGSWPHMGAAARGDVLRRAAAELRERTDELARLITLETGKPIVQARGEIQTTANLFDHFTHLALEAHGESYAISGTYDALVTREPVGVVAAIVPWNFPIMMLAFKLAPALAVGCTVVCKPAELTNSIVAEVCEILRRAGVSDGALNMVSGQGTVVGAALAESPLVDRVTFTGSTDVGRSVMRGAAENLTRVGLELGGKSPHLVFADTARMDDAVDAACCNVFFNQGAVCDGGTRLLLERRIHDEFLEKLIAKTETLTVGDPMTDVHLGPIISEERCRRLRMRKRPSQSRTTAVTALPPVSGQRTSAAPCVWRRRCARGRSTSTISAWDRYSCRSAAASRAASAGRKGCWASRNFWRQRPSTSRRRRRGRTGRHERRNRDAAKNSGI